jgi:LacI family transcriptional regulator
MSVSVKDVALAAGVSISTVSNVLNHPQRVAKKTVKAVQKSIEELGFVRNDVARQLRAGRSRSIGMLVLDVRNPFFTDLARGADEATDEHKMNLLLANSDENSDRELAILGVFEEQRVHGILVTPASDNLAGLVKVRDRGTPIVLVDRISHDRNFSSVSVDDVAGGYMAAKHLIECGRKRLAYVGGPLTIRQVVDRLQGAQKAVKEHPDVTLEVIDCPSLSILAGRNAGESLLTRNSVVLPDGIFAANDLVAIGIMQACIGSDQIKIPKDMSLIGYDDISFAATATIALTSIRQPTLEMGAQAVALLMQEADRAEGDKEVNHIEFQPELVIRDSTR